MARIVVPGLAHHVTQRGNRRQQTFFSDEDYQVYKDLVAEHCGEAGVAVWAYCLMPNHVHLILVPETGDGLAEGLGEAHRRYTRRINFREGWRGYLWQGRFASFPLDEAHLHAAGRYVELNPVRAGLVRRAKDWPWSSARAHLKGRDDDLVSVAPMLERIPDWRAYLRSGLGEGERELVRQHERTGRPLGSEDFIAGLESQLGRPLKKRKPGPKKGGGKGVGRASKRQASRQR
jgi:putative transposase